MKSFKEFLKEASEWETRHDEFTKAGEEVTNAHIDDIIIKLKKLSDKTTSKHGFINSLFGGKSNGDLARVAYSADYIQKLLLKNKNAKLGSEERKQLGQHYIYAKSLIERN